MNTQNNKHLRYENTSRYKTALRFVFKWLLIIAVFVIIFAKIEFAHVIHIIQSADIKFLCIGIAFSVVAHVIFASGRYQKVVEFLGCRLSFFEAVIIRMGCNPIKGILPFKTGELAIAAYMKKKHDLSYPQGLFSLLFGYFFSLVALIVFFSCGGIFYFNHPSQIIICAMLLLMGLFFITPFSISRIQKLLNWYVNKFQKKTEEITSLIQKDNSGAIRHIFLHSLGIEGSKLLIIYAILKSLRMEIPVNALLFLGSITIIAAYLPITYWGLGVRESAVLFLFAGYAAPEKLLAGSLLITLIDGLLPVLLGLFFIQSFLNGLRKNEKEGRDVTSNST